LCVYCKKGRVYASTAKKRTCQCCGETKRLKTEFTWLKTAGEYAVDCRVCRAKVRDAEKAVRDEAEALRKEDDAKWKAMSESQTARQARNQRAKEVRVIETSDASTNTTNPFDWRTYVQPYQLPQPERKNAAHSRLVI
jgi:hypothetical protein